MLLAAKSGWASAPSLYNGSDSTRLKNIPVGVLALSFGNGRSTLMYFMPDLISSDITYQVEHTEKWEDVKDKSYWGNIQINKKHSEFE